MFGLGIPELLIVLGVFVLLFGGAKLPGLMRNMGRSINEFKVGMEEKPVPRNIDKADGGTENAPDVPAQKEKVG